MVAYAFFFLCHKACACVWKSLKGRGPNFAVEMDRKDSPLSYSSWLTGACNLLQTDLPQRKCGNHSYRLISTLRLQVQIPETISKSIAEHCRYRWERLPITFCNSFGCDATYGSNSVWNFLLMLEIRLVFSLTVPQVRKLDLVSFPYGSCTVSKKDKP